jgi:hypothetical protein
MATIEAFSMGQIGPSIDGGTYAPAENDGGLPSPEEGHRLMLAFVSIRQPALREAIIRTMTELSGHRADGGVSLSGKF